MTHEEIFNKAAEKDIEGRMKCMSYLIMYLIGKGCQYKFITPDNVYSPIDMIMEVTTPTNKKAHYNIEIKNLNKVYENGYNIIKEEKYNNMINAKENESILLYICMESDKYMYIYNLDKIDFSKLDKKQMIQKVSEVDPDSEIRLYPTYFLPKELATKINLQNILEKWENPKNYQYQNN